MENFFENTIESHIAYKGKILNVNLDKVSLQNNSIVDREVVKKQNAACVVALTNDKRIVLVKQFRYAFNRPLLEIPAGKMDKTDKTPLHCAKRELVEETGFTAKRWINLGSILPCPGFCTEKLFMFLALNSVKTQNPSPDPDEFVQTALVDFNLFANQLSSACEVDAKTLCGVLKTQLLFKLNVI